MDIEEIRILKVRPGDTLVVRTNSVLSLEQVEKMKSHFQSIAPGTPVVVLDREMSLDILREERGAR